MATKKHMPQVPQLNEIYSGRNIFFLDHTVLGMTVVASVPFTVYAIVYDQNGDKSKRTSIIGPYTSEARRFQFGKESDFIEIETQGGAYSLRLDYIEKERIDTQPMEIAMDYDDSIEARVKRLFQIERSRIRQLTVDEGKSDTFDEPEFDDLTLYEVAGLEETHYDQSTIAESIAEKVDQTINQDRSVDRQAPAEKGESEKTDTGKSS